MLWLQPVPWARWAAAVAVAVLALWFELGGGASTEHPFALVDIGRGEPLTSANVEMRKVPAGLLEPPGEGTVAAREITAGAPILPGDATFPDRMVPEGWWVVSAEMPPNAMKGDLVRIVLLDGGGLIEGVVVAGPSGDAFAMGTGSVAVPPNAAELVARAAATGRLVVLVGTG